MGLRPVSFAWNKKGRELTNRKYREREIGFIAQEAQSVSDQYVAENPVAKSDEGDAYLTVQKDEMIADLVAMVQQLNRRIAKLEGA
jgi:ABC-type sugar transport system ATPase subunit